MAILSPEMRAWLRLGLAGAMTAADSDRRPEIIRVWAARPLPQSDSLELVILRAGSERFLANVRASQRAAANLIEVPTYRSRAFKGDCRISEAPIDRAFVDEAIAALDADFEKVGLPARASALLMAHGNAPPTMLALVLDVQTIFDQSPKPGAGAPL